MVSERLQRIREKVNRREKKVRADRQAKARRIEKGDPDGVSETAQVKFRGAKNEAQMSAGEARELASDAKTLLSTELGISRSESEGVITKGAALLDEAGSQIDSLDGDGDGDTDLLGALDAPAGGSGGGSGKSESKDITDPIFEPSGGSGGGNGGSSGSDELFNPLDDDNDGFL